MKTISLPKFRNIIGFEPYDVNKFKEGEPTYLIAILDCGCRKLVLRPDLVSQISKAICDECDKIEGTAPESRD